MTLRLPARPGPGSLWIGGRTPATSTSGGPTLHRDEAVLWLDATRDAILAARVVTHKQADVTLADLLLQAVRQRGGATPAFVRVASEHDASLVRRVLPGVAIEVGPTPEVARCARSLTGDPDSDDVDAPGYLEGGTLAPAEMERFFEFMAALWRAAPWRFFNETQVLELDVPALGVSGACVAVQGASGGMPAVGLFGSFEDFEQSYSLYGRLPEDRDGCADLGISSLGLTFSRGADLPGGMRLEVTRQGWAVAGPDAFPQLVPVGPDARFRPVTERDLRLGCAAAAVLAAFVRQHPRHLRVYKADERLHSISLQDPWRMEATIRYPHPHAPVDAGAWRHFTDTGRDRSRREADRWLDAFLESPPARRHTDTWRGNAAYMISSFQGFRLNGLDGRLRGLRAWHVTEFLLIDVPGNVLADAVMVRQTPEIFDAYLEWLGEMGHEPAPLTARIRSLVGRTREAFAQKALDPASFSPGKTFLLSAQAEGVDLDDLAAVVAYGERYDRRSQEARPR